MLRLTSLPLQGYLAACVAVLAIAVGIHWVVIKDANFSLEHAKRLDVSWSASNGRIEIEKLRASIGQYAVSRAPTDHTRARIQIAIVKSRLETWSNGDFSKLVAADPALTRSLANARAEIAKVDALFADPGQPLDAEGLLTAAYRLSRIFHSIGATAYEKSLTKATSIRQRLENSQMFQTWLIRALLVFGSLLLLITIRQNRSLKTASALAQSNADRYSFLARHDQVTGLANRMVIDETLNQLATRETHHGKVCVLAIDLDGFKSVNDTLGHAAGDAALEAVANQLMAVVEPFGEDCVVARVGGDEFLVLLVVDNVAWDFEQFASTVLDGFRGPLETNFGTVELGMSIGIAESRHAEIPGFSLLMNADLALTDAKLTGKNRVVAYHDDLRIRLKRREMIESDLKIAISTGQIHLAYQPQFSMTTGDCIGYEVLARWTHPELGPISPGEFIPLAETSGLIVELGEFVLLSACRNAAQWPDHLYISVNLSIAQILKDDIVDCVSEVLRQSGLAAERLKLEVTETMLISDFGHTRPILESLQALGVKISLDDFGTGYSGLSYLSKFSWDEIKIDRSFVVAAEESDNVRNVVNLVIQMAAQLGACVTVEGIETETQYTLFTGFGCTNAQGFYLGRPTGLGTVQHDLRHRYPDFFTGQRTGRISAAG
ncbi:putative bifunctional diguanylate cyclase/phosphodiesterase [Coralliovum pocilloporae]|uniref:putative bifunctional diguanylate cyclase/phosphodiesterase n=1 Tax=Coralliovum pocilloporae TaxID=3066369 RepID=UPI003306F5FF